MKTSALLKLHQRTVDILDMIVTCEKRITMWKLDKRVHAGNWLIQSMNDNADKNISRNSAIKERLIRYYLDIQQRIKALQPTIELNTIKEVDLSTHLS